VSVWPAVLLLKRIGRAFGGKRIDRGLLRSRQLHTGSVLTKLTQLGLWGLVSQRMKMVAVRYGLHNLVGDYGSYTTAAISTVSSTTAAAINTMSSSTRPRLKVSGLAPGAHYVKSAAASVRTALTVVAPETVTNVFSAVAAKAFGVSRTDSSGGSATGQEGSANASSTGSGSANAVQTQEFLQQIQSDSSPSAPTDP